MPKQSYKDNPTLRPAFSLQDQLRKRHEYAEDEVGLTHPENQAFIRLNDHGDIEIFSAPGVGIVISGSSRTIVLHADSIKFYTKDDGLRWNNHCFNSAASTYIEPTLVKINMDKVHPAIGNIEYYLNNTKEIERQQSVEPVTIVGSYMFDDAMDPSLASANADAYRFNLTNEQVSLLNEYAKNHTEEQVTIMKRLMSQGNSFTEAREKVNRGLY